jgi:O-antigen/teichoic acid export membrane protein
LKRAARSQPARAAYIYIFSSILNSAIPFLLLPLLTRVLVPADYAAVVMFQALFTVSGTVTLFGLRAVVMRHLSVAQPDMRARSVSSSTVLISITSVVAVLLSWIFAPQLEEVSGLSLAWILVSVIAGAATSFFQIYITVLQVDNRPILFGAMQIALTSANVGLTLLLVLGTHYGWVGRVLGIALSNTASGVVAIVALRALRLLVRPDVPSMKEDVWLGGSAIPHAFANVVMTYTDRFFLTAYSTADTVGIYAIANQLSTGLLVMGQALGSASTPWIFRRMASLRSMSDGRKLLKICAGLSLLMLILSVGVYFALLFTMRWIIGARYLGATIYLPWLMGAAFFNNIYLFFSPVLFYYKRPGIISGSGIFIFFAGLGLVYLLAARYGAVGVAAAMCGARFLLFAMTFLAALYITMSDLRRRAAEALVGAVSPETPNRI